MENPVIKITDLVKVYKEGKVRAVDKLNLEVYEGEIYALIGANGSGKTTTMNLLNGAIYPTSGKIEMFGYEMPKDRDKISPMIGIAPQEYSIYSDLTVSENIHFFASLYGMKKNDVEKYMNELLKVLELSQKKNVIVSKLSGGMKRRVSIACCLIHYPRIVFFDEATVGVDPVLRKYFWEYFRYLRDNGVTIIITSHIMDEAERADRIGLMRQGKLIAQGTPEELLRQFNAKNVEEVFLKLS